jgi:hypothetical protein
MRKIILSLTAVVLLATSCKKGDNDEESLAVTKENIAGTYKITSFTIGGQEFLTQYTEACQRDDIFTFKTDLTYTYTDAGTKCDPDGSYTDGEWSVPSGTTFEYDGDTYTVSKFTNKTLQISSGSAPATMVLTFSRQ